MQQENKQNQDQTSSSQVAQKKTPFKSKYKSKQSSKGPIQAKWNGQPLQPITSKHTPIQAKHKPISKGKTLLQKQQKGSQVNIQPVNPVKTYWGTWTARVQAENDQQNLGVKMVLEFAPNPSRVDSSLIEMVQVIRVREGGEISYLENKSDPEEKKLDVYFGKYREKHSIKKEDAILIDKKTGETDEGTHIDAWYNDNNPLYRLNEYAKNLTEGGQEKAEISGFISRPGRSIKGKDDVKPAYVVDNPHIPISLMKPGARANSSQIFETSALAVKGRQKNTYYGSVRWGWKTNNQGRYELLPLTVVSMGAPSSSFFKAAEVWNRSKSNFYDKGDVDTVDLPLMDIKVLDQNNVDLKQNIKKDAPSLAKLTKNTRFIILKNSNFFKAKYKDPKYNTEQMRIEIVDGEHTGKQGFIGDKTLLLDEDTQWRNQQKKK